MTTTLEIPATHLLDVNLRRYNSAQLGQQESNEVFAESDVTPSRLLSFVIPVKDEEASLIELRNGIAANIPDNCAFEIIFIDDGSDDGSWAVIQKLVRQHPEEIRGVRFRRNAGKAAGLTAGFRAARGDVVFTMDGDLQDDPREIRRFLATLDSGYGLVSGWKKVRHDPWHKVLPSRLFNWMLSRVSGVNLHDHNCGFKCYHGELARQLTLHGELHRMVPALAAMLGYAATEIVVEHHPRRFGQSKYGIERFLRGFSDMLTMGFLRRFGERPSHFLNGFACFYLTIAATCGIGSVLRGYTSNAGLLIAMAGLIFAGMAAAVFVVGLLSELFLRGGLQTGWRLPIDEDTACDESAEASRTTRSSPAFADRDPPRLFLLMYHASPIPDDAASVSSHILPFRFSAF